MHIKQKDGPQITHTNKHTYHTSGSLILTAFNTIWIRFAIILCVCVYTKCIPCIWKVIGIRCSYIFRTRQKPRWYTSRIESTSSYKFQPNQQNGMKKCNRDEEPNTEVCKKKNNNRVQFVVFASLKKCGSIAQYLNISRTGNECIAKWEMPTFYSALLPLAIAVVLFVVIGNFLLVMSFFNF